MIRVDKEAPANERIAQAFVLLLREKPYHKISVAQVTKLAGVNRSTFYRYYCDVYDLVEKLTDRLIDWLVGKLMITSDRGRFDFQLLNSIGSAPINQAIETFSGSNGVSDFYLRFNTKYVAALNRIARANDAFNEKTDFLHRYITLASEISFDIERNSGREVDFGRIFDICSMVLFFDEAGEDANE